MDMQQKHNTKIYLNRSWIIYND